ncbi:hypothetical protein Bbelb_278140 [Branchiostoma belcheri]|nr:hypothetical protein Bbelb_278140 [Branchiostoma belcheri]
MAQDPVKCPTPGRLRPTKDSPGLLERMASIQVHTQNIQEAEELGCAPLNCIDRRAEEAAMNEASKVQLCDFHREKAWVEWVLKGANLKDLHLSEAAGLPPTASTAHGEQPTPGEWAALELDRE